MGKVVCRGKQEQKPFCQELMVKMCVTHVRKPALLCLQICPWRYMSVLQEDLNLPGF